LTDPLPALRHGFRLLGETNLARLGRKIVSRDATDAA
jgi:hypothetical protein